MKYKKYSNIKRCYLFPKTLSSALTPSISRSLQKRGFTNSDIIRDWAKIVGIEMAKNCYPIKITKSSNKYSGRIYIRTKAGAWAMRLQYNEAIILEKLSSYYGYNIANHIMIMQ